MRESDQEPHPYWHEDVLLGEGRFYRGETYTIRMRLHTETERYHRRQELVPLSQQTGQRIYVHGKPYILEPDITLTVALTQEPSPTGAIGEVVASEWEGMRQRDIGQAQAWYYPADQLVMLWECFPEDWCSGEDPRTDETLATLWTGFEAWLVGRFPDARRMATTWEDKYDRPAWAAFVAGQGYHQTAPAAFTKNL